MKKQSRANFGLRIMKRAEHDYIGVIDCKLRNIGVVILSFKKSFKNSGIFICWFG